MNAQESFRPPDGYSKTEVDLKFQLLGQQLDSKLDRVLTELVNFKTEIKSDIAELEFKFKADLQNEIGVVNSEIASIKSEIIGIKSEIAGVKLDIGYVRLVLYTVILPVLLAVMAIEVAIVFKLMNNPL